MADEAAAHRSVPIAGHGLIGDLRSCALVDVHATISWFCPGRFDAPSVFASLLDPDAGGWTITPDDPETRTHQFYLPDSAVLVTRLLCEHGVAEVQDFMPVLRPDDADHRQRIVRRVVGVRGTTRLTTTVAVRPAYGAAAPEVAGSDDGVLLTADGLRLALTASASLTVSGTDVTAGIEVGEGDVAVLVLEVLDADDEHRGPEGGALATDAADDLVSRTTAYWRDWLARSSYTGRWREMVHRSVLTLKLLTHEPTGAVVAAPTTSLPEEIGGSRNWDYRYVWLRDAAFTIYAFLTLGFTDEAARFMTWLSERMGEDEDGDLGPLRVAYDIDGGLPAEQELEHLRGYRDSRPVRVGNAATDQLQLDVYGELIDSVYLFNKYGPGISHDAWTDLTRILDWLMDNWEREDSGMWEIRDAPRAHTTSRLMCWVAVERMMRMARQRGLPGDLSAWAEVRDRIYERIMTRSWDETTGAFMQHEGGSTLDAGVLLMPMVKFVAPNDPRFASTLRAVEDRLVSDSLVFRYDQEQSDDGIEGAEGTFSLCSFWYVEALTRVGRLDDARLALEKMFTYANHLGLYAEQVGLTGDQLGNFPQAFTHLALISAAFNLDRELDR